MNAMAVAALELAGHASEGRAVGRFIRAISAIILSISNRQRINLELMSWLLHHRVSPDCPPKRNADGSAWAGAVWFVRIVPAIVGPVANPATMDG